MEREVRKTLRDLAQFEMPKKFLLLPRDFSVEAGELTPTLKVRRRVVEERHRRRSRRSTPTTERPERRPHRRGVPTHTPPALASSSTSPPAGIGPSPTTRSPAAPPAPPRCTQRGSPPNGAPSTTPRIERGLERQHAAAQHAQPRRPSTSGRRIDRHQRHARDQRRRPRSGARPGAPDEHQVAAGPVEAHQGARAHRRRATLRRRGGGGASPVSKTPSAR